MFIRIVQRMAYFALVIRPGLAHELLLSSLSLTV